MNWYIVYKGKSSSGKDSLKENLERAGINYYIPMRWREQLKDDRMVFCSVPALNNLIFIQTNRNIVAVANEIDGLKSPYKNRATGEPATVSEEELRRFRQVLEAKNLSADILSDEFSRFAQCPKVRVKAGEFKGLEGHVFRIRHDRKLIISLDNMAIAISGIHFSLLERIE